MRGCRQARRNASAAKGSTTAARSRSVGARFRYYSVLIRFVLIGVLLVVVCGRPSEIGKKAGLMRMGLEKRENDGETFLGQRWG